MRNTLFYGDNLVVLREHIKAESVDLIYLDPPFNSNRSYNVLFKDESGKEADAQIRAFNDTWHWNQQAEDAYRRLLMDADDRVSRTIEAMRGLIGERSQMMAYLVMMAARLVELHRVLKPTGSLYLHCDPTASHYLKVLLDAIFGAERYLNEITWKRTTAHNDARRQFADVADSILLYSKGPKYTFNVVYVPHSQDYIDLFYNHQDPDGRRWQRGNLASPNPRPNLTYEYKGRKPPAKGWRYTLERMRELDEQGRLHFPKDPDGRIRLKLYLDESPGQPVSSVWDDIAPIHSLTAERLGYPTQKPLALLERIIAASSNPGDVVLDPFCGCGTAIAAAQRLGRHWIGIDITHLSIALQKYRLRDAFDLGAGKDYDVKGEPVDLASAQQLASEDRYQFQWWALSLIQARPLGSADGGKTGKKGADSGIDGTIAFVDDGSGKAKRILAQVKSGHVNRGAVGELVGAVQREQAAMGVFITLEPPTQQMMLEAVKAGYYHSPGWNQDYPKIQVFTVQQLLEGAIVKRPPSSITFKAAAKAEQDDSQLGFRFR